MNNNYALNFQQLPSGVQTALMNYTYNYGRLQGDILNDVGNLDWSQLGNDLIALGGRFVASGEAVLSYIQKKELPSKGLPC